MLNHSVSQFLLLASLLAGAPALADIRNMQSASDLIDDGDERTTFEDRIPGTPGVLPGDVASFALEATALNGTTVFASGAGHSPVIRGSTFVDIGAHRFGSGRVEVRWDEVVSSGRTFLQFVIRTSDQAAFFPSNASVDGFQLATWNWRMGLIDPVQFLPEVQSVQLVSATALFSRTWGTSFFATQNFTASLPADFRAGRDEGVSLASIGDGMNSMLIRYEVDITVPGPGSSGLIACGILMKVRRRRSRQ